VHREEDDDVDGDDEGGALGVFSIVSYVGSNPQRLLRLTGRAAVRMRNFIFPSWRRPRNVDVTRGDYPTDERRAIPLQKDADRLEENAAHIRPS